MHVAAVPNNSLLVRVYPASANEQEVNREFNPKLTSIKYKHIIDHDRLLVDSRHIVGN